MVAGAWLGSLLPDADRAGSRIYRSRRRLGRLARLPLRVLLVLRHRGVTHSLAACAVAALVAGLLAPPLGAGVAIGYLAHIAADACTPSGVAVFAPLSRRRRHLVPSFARIPTGSAREFVVATLMTVATVAATVLLAG
jgi:inner membrane protein